MPTPPVATRLRGDGGVHVRRVLALAVGALAWVVWILLFAGAFGDQRDHVAIGLQLTASAVAAVALGAAARRPRPPMGPATGPLGIGAAVWFVSGVVWLITIDVNGAAPSWLTLGYAAGTAIMAAALWSTSGMGAIDGVVPVSRTVAVIDSVLIAGGIGLWWLHTVWEPLVDSTQTAVTMTLAVVDAAFLAGAVLHWSRAAAPRRANATLVLLAAVVLVGTDVAYAGDLSGYAVGDAVDVGWFTVAAFLAGATFEPRWSARLVRPGVSTVARWVQAVLAPGLVVVVLASIAIRHEPPAGDHGPLLDAAIWVLMVGLLIRQVVQLSEQVVLNRRLSESTQVLRHQAEHDDLTGLLDRHAFHDRVDRALAARSSTNDRLAFLWIHLDSIGQINDLLGTAVGDRVLAAVAGRLRSVCGETDHISRYEDGAFVVLRPQADRGLDRWAEDVRVALAEVFDVDGVRVRLTTAIGLIETAPEVDTSSALLSEVSVAMASVKREGRNRVTRRLIDAERAEHHRSQLAQDLRAAIDERRLRVHYQPICDIHTGHVLGSEALVRFDHPTRGAIAPEEFLPVAEVTGLMPELAMLVLDEACITFADDPGLGWVAVNLSASDLADPRLLDWVRATLDRTGLDPGRLVIEITERVVPEPDVVRGIHRLRELGISLALDDFGSAWTSLAQVEHLAIRLVKLDRSIVARLDGPAADRFRALVRTVVTLADLHDVVVLAEGVETDRQRDECRAAGVRLGQGFLWAPALPVTAMVRYVATAPSAMLDPDYHDPVRP